MNWHLITGEYPPKCGGVGDYTARVARALAEAGDAVSVWCPSHCTPPGDGLVRVRPELGRLGWGDLRRVDRLLDAEPKPRRLLLQWVPHAFGKRAVNYPFCRWLRRRVGRGDSLSVMIHEAFLDYAGSWKKRLAAFVQRLMLRELLAEAEAIWVSTAAWLPLVRPFAPPHRPLEWLPVFSNVPVLKDAAATQAVRQQLTPEGEPLIGHFGTFGGHTTSLLTACLTTLLRKRSEVRLLLLGLRGPEFRQMLVDQGLVSADRISAPGRLEAKELSVHLAACDVMVQPYLGGISTRNGSLMACLAHGQAVVGSRGWLTEPLWDELQAVELVEESHPAGMAEAVCLLLDDPGRRHDLARRAKDAYEARFALQHTVARLRQLPVRV